MVYKRTVMLAIALLTSFSLTTCNNENANNETYTENTTNELDQISQTVISTADKLITTDKETQSAETKTENITEEEISDFDSDPTHWKTEEIVEYYKNSAVKTNPTAKSIRNITMSEISVNNGEYENVFEFITPIMSKILAKNSTEIQGITGGFTKLSANDVKNAKAYKKGSNTVIEMTMKNQVAGPREDMNEGTVGHAMAVVGDIGVVVDQLKDFGLPLEISDKDTKIYYTDAKLNVVIDSDGNIIDGMWKYTVDIRLNNYKAFGKDVQTTSVVMVNTITLL